MSAGAVSRSTTLRPSALGGFGPRLYLITVDAVSPAEPLEPFSTKSDYAYLRVREQILTGVLEPGSVLNQATLAKQIGISTTPLREALRRLKVEGLVHLDAHRDAHVADLSAEEARDMLEMRRSLDPLGAALAAERRTKGDIAEIRAAAERLEPLPVNASVAHLTTHRRFHAAIYRASHNDLLIKSLDELWDKADRYRLLALQVDRGDAAREQKRLEHQQLMEAVVAGDSDHAFTVMQAHIETSLGVQAAWRLRKPSLSASAT
jgi:DNA-binding GntR family transcriptional regulator